MPLGLFCPFSGATVGLLELLTHCGQKDAEDSGGALVYSRWWWGFAWSRHWRSRQLSLAVYLSVRDASPSTYVRCFVCAAKMNLPSWGGGEWSWDTTVRSRGTKRVVGMTCWQPPGVSVHLFKEFVGGVLVAVVLHLVELPLLWRQHGVDLLGERRGYSNCGTKLFHKLSNSDYWIYGGRGGGINQLFLQWLYWLQGPVCV